MQSKSPETPRRLRQFGFSVGAVLGLLAGWSWLRDRPVYPYLLCPAVLLLGLALAYPRALRWVYKGWMALGLVLGHIVSTILLIAIFFLVVTPIGLLARTLGKDFLNRRLDRRSASYWLARDQAWPRPKNHYEQQF